MEMVVVEPLVTDDDLVARHRYGDASAFDELFRRFQGMVFNVCYRMAGRTEDAEDLTQEVFVRLFRHLAKFGGRSSLKTWVYRVTINHCRSRLGRKRLPMQSLDGDGIDGRPARQVADPRRSPERRAMARDDAARIGMALARVASPYREAVILCDLEGLSYEEIAQVLRVRIGTVRSRIARGRQRLRESLESEETP